MNEFCYCEDGPSVFKETTPVAKKAHRCLECRRAILAGQKYHRYWGIWNGDQSTFKMCDKCAKLLEYVMAHVKCFCFYYGNIHDDILQELDQLGADGDLLRSEVQKMIEECKAQPEFKKEAA